MKGLAALIIGALFCLYMILWLLPAHSADAPPAAQTTICNKVEQGDGTGVYKCCAVALDAALNLRSKCVMFFTPQKTPPTPSMKG